MLSRKTLTNNALSDPGRALKGPRRSARIVFHHALAAACLIWLCGCTHTLEESWPHYSEYCVAGSPPLPDGALDFVFNRVLRVQNDATVELHFVSLSIFDAQGKRLMGCAWDGGAAPFCLPDESQIAPGTGAVVHLPVDAVFGILKFWRFHNNGRPFASEEETRLRFEGSRPFWAIH